MAIDFPDSPSNGSTYTYQGITFTWIDLVPTGYWKVNTPGSLGPATGAEVDTGTDNAKYLTPLAIQDSGYATETYADSYFAQGTGVIFINATAPDGWTIAVTHDNRALRLSNSNGGSFGGTMDFNAAFAVRGLTGTVINETAGGTVINETAGGTVINTYAGGAVTVDYHALTIAEMPAHTHTLDMQHSELGVSDDPTFGNGGQNRTATTSSTGSGLGHRHTASFNPDIHNHAFVGDIHNHGFVGDIHNHGLVMDNLDMTVKYTQGIVCTKDVI